MALLLKLAVSTRNARLDALETDIGTSPVLKLWSGSPPTDCAAADSGGTLIASLTIPNGGGDWMANATAGSKAMAGTWSTTAASAGTVGHFRIYTTGGTVCKVQGTAGSSGTDMIVDNPTVTLGQAIAVTAFTLNESANA